MRFIYWLAGERSLCLYRKKEILKPYIKNGFNIKNLEIENTDLLIRELSEKSLFGSFKNVYIINNTIPEPKKTLPFIKKVANKNKIIIFLDGDSSKKSSKVDKRKFLYKNAKEYLEYFEPIINGERYPKKELINRRIKDIIKYSNCDFLKDNQIKNILKKSFYDCGKTIKEIEKIKTIFYDKKEEITDQDIVNVIEDQNMRPIEDLLFSLSKKNMIEFYKIYNRIIDINDFSRIFMSVFGSIIELYNFFKFCKISMDAGCKDKNDISDYVSNIWIKNGKPVTKQQIYSRLYFYYDDIANISIDDIMNIIKNAEECIYLCMNKGYKNNYSYKYIINDFMLKSFF